MEYNLDYYLNLTVEFKDIIRDNDIPIRKLNDNDELVQKYMASYKINTDIHSAENCLQLIKNYRLIPQYYQGLLQFNLTPCSCLELKNKQKAKESYFWYRDFPDEFLKNTVKSTTKLLHKMNSNNDDLVSLLLDTSKKCNKNQNFRGFYVSGETNSGKTKSLISMANYYASKKYSVCFVDTPRIYKKFKRFFDDKYGADKSDSLIQKLSNCNVLIFDDIGGEPASEWFRDTILFQILNARVQNSSKLKITYFSSNFKPEELKSYYAKGFSKNTPPGIKAERILSRIKQLTQFITVVNRKNL